MKVDGDSSSLQMQGKSPHKTEQLGCKQKMFVISKNGVTDIPRRDKDKINNTVFYLEDTTATLNSND